MKSEAEKIKELLENMGIPLTHVRHPHKLEMKAKAKYHFLAPEKRSKN